MSREVKVCLNPIRQVDSRGGGNLLDQQVSGARDLARQVEATLDLITDMQNGLRRRGAEVQSPHI